MTISEAELADYSRVLRQIAPDVPLRLVAAENLPPTFRCGHSFTSPALPETLAEWLPEGERQPVAVLDWPWGQPGRLRWASVLHEASHVVAEADVFMAESIFTTPAATTWLREQTAAQAAESREATANGTDWVPGRYPLWSTHGDKFCRVACHLVWRALHVANACRADIRLVCGQPYGLSCGSEYARVLGDEPARLAGADFAAILRTKPPTEFERLWLADIVAWSNTQAGQSFLTSYRKDRLT